ncbi:alpha/beta fold hydrolase [Pirellulales bacterium]|nr:alpha/beta fold hydrolase [Pirellulales bacterium]
MPRSVESAERRYQTDTIAQWQAQRHDILRCVEQVMGRFPAPDRSAPLLPEFLSATTSDSIVLHKVSYHTDDANARVHAWLIVPRETKAEVMPAVLCLHQTTCVGKDEPAGLAGNENLSYARELAERGFVTLAPDYPSFGEYEYNFETDDYESGSMKAIYDNTRAVDFLSTLEYVDSDRIGVMGHSLGGHNSIFTAVFDARLRAVVSNCGFTSFAKYYGGDLAGWSSQRYMPRILDAYDANPAEVPFDFPDLIAAIAPRPFLAIAPLHDHNFEVTGVRDVMSAAAPVYDLYESGSQLQAEYPDCKHEFPPAQRKRAYEFLKRHLSSQLEEHK